MKDRPTEIERAFQLARSGGPASVEDIKKQLSREGYTAKQIDGPLLIKQLRELGGVLAVWGGIAWLAFIIWVSGGTSP
jgi:hypothetical protein